MTPEAYRELRKAIGTQKYVAILLGVARETISDRERGVLDIRREAELALYRLAEQSKQAAARRERYQRRKTNVLATTYLAPDLDRL